MLHVSGFVTDRVEELRHKGRGCVWPRLIDLVDFVAQATQLFGKVLDRGDDLRVNSHWPRCGSGDHADAEFARPRRHLILIAAQGSRGVEVVGRSGVADHVVHQGGVGGCASERADRAEGAPQVGVGGSGDSATGGL